VLINNDYTLLLNGDSKAVMTRMRSPCSTILLFLLYLVYRLGSASGTYALVLSPE
jgi:hypothetical protein